MPRSALVFRSSLAGAILLSVAFSTSSTASVLSWEGSLELHLTELPRAFFFTGTGVATVNGSGGGAYLSTLRLAGGISGMGTIPQTDPETPTFISLRADVGLGTGTVSGLSGGAPIENGVAALLTGRLTQCVLFPGCGNYIPIPLTQRGTRGVGIGGTIFVTQFEKGAAPAFSLYGAPWTLGAASITGVPNRITLTQNGIITSRFTVHETRTAQGFAHGPASGTSSAAAVSGGVQLVTPIRIQTNRASPHNLWPAFGVLALRFVPEPGGPLLLGAGIALLAVGCRKRSR
ncbi:MAG: PEP-CTERM sorting domain-containing protein [Myxococcales bacterium]|nr:PEP-CTERM sorting domain-containing protein [Myxococcales bacterium]